jgi:hypothetical protein
MAEEVTKEITKESYFKLDGAQYAIILGVSLSAMMSFVQIYNSISQIGNQEQQDLSEDTKKALQTRFIVMLVLACLCIILGMGLGFYFKDKDQYKLITFSLVVGGIITIVYALITNYERQPWMAYTKMGLSLTSLVAFIILGYLYQTENETLMGYINKYKCD